MKHLLRHRGLWYGAASAVFLLISLIAASSLLTFLFIWFAVVCAYMALGYFLSFTKLLFKNSKGRIPLPIKIFLLPFFVSIHCYNWLSRHASKEPGFQEIYPGLVIGRRVLPADVGELEQQNIHAVLDVTAEFDALSLALMNTGIEYRNIAIFDHSTPSLRDLHKSVDLIHQWKKQGKNVLVHCALGRGRSAMVILAYLIFKSPSADIRKLMEDAQAIRSEIRPNFRQLRLLEKYKQSDYVQKRKLSACLIINPTAGSYTGDELLAEIKEHLHPFYHLETEFTTPDVGAEEIAKRAVKFGHSLVIACGGDGTVSAVASALVGSNTALGILPMGTANALANCLYGVGNTSDVSVNCERIAQHKLRRIDTALCNDHTVILLAGIGIESGMISRADSSVKKRWGVMAYIAGALQELTDYKNLNINLKVDEKTLEISTYSLIVANAAPLTSILAQGGGEPVCDDGFLDVTWLEHKDEPGQTLVSMVELVQRGLLENTDTEYVHHEKGRVIEFSAGELIPVVIDGELFEFERVRIECVPNSLSVIA